MDQFKEVKHGISSQTTPDVNVNVNDQSVLSAPAKLAGNSPESTNISSSNDQSPPLSTRDASHGQISDEFEILGDDEIQGQDQDQEQGQEQSQDQDQDQEQEQEDRNATPISNPSVYHDASPELGPNDHFAVSLIELMTVFGLDINEYTPVLLRLQVYSAGQLIQLMGAAIAFIIHRVTPASAVRYHQELGMLMTLHTYMTTQLGMQELISDNEMVRTLCAGDLPSWFLSEYFDVYHIMIQPGISNTINQRATAIMKEITTRLHSSFFDVAVFEQGENQGAEETNVPENVMQPNARSPESEVTTPRHAAAKEDAFIEEQKKKARIARRNLQYEYMMQDRYVEYGDMNALGANLIPDIPEEKTTVYTTPGNEAKKPAAKPKVETVHSPQPKKGDPTVQVEILPDPDNVPPAATMPSVGPTPEDYDSKKVNLKPRPKVNPNQHLETNVRRNKAAQMEVDRHERATQQYLNAVLEPEAKYSARTNEGRPVVDPNVLTERASGYPPLGQGRGPFGRAPFNPNRAGR